MIHSNIFLQLNLEKANAEDDVISKENSSHSHSWEMKAAFVLIWCTRWNHTFICELHYIDSILFIWLWQCFCTVSLSLSRAGVISLRTPLISPLSSLHCRCLHALSCLPLVPITAPLVSLSDIYTIDMIVLTLNLTRPVSRARALLLSSTVESLHYTVSDVRAARLHDILLSLPEPQLCETFAYLKSPLQKDSVRRALLTAPVWDLNYSLCLPLVSVYKPLSALLEPTWSRDTIQLLMYGCIYTLVLINVEMNVITWWHLSSWVATTDWYRKVKSRWKQNIKITKKNKKKTQQQQQLSELWCNLECSSSSIRTLVASQIVFKNKEWICWPSPVLRPDIKIRCVSVFHTETSAGSWGTSVGLSTEAEVL